MDFVTRFAPSPTGLLHLGHALSAMTAWRAAREAGGLFLLRIEDIDRERCRPAFEAAMLEDLAWLGLDWDAPPRRQSDHMADYAAALEQLKAEGLLYRCFRTRREVLDEMARAPHGPAAPFGGEPLAPENETRRADAGEPYAWRLSLDRARSKLGARWDALGYTDVDRGPVIAHPENAGDVVLARKDLGVAYHLASVVDDGLQGVTQVIRGEDLREAADIHRLLQALLGLPTPDYRHHPLLLGADGKRLAKRDGAISLRALRESGLEPADVRARVGF